MSDAFKELQKRVDASEGALANGFTVEAREIMLMHAAKLVCAEGDRLEALLDLCEELVKAVAMTKVKPVEDMALTQAWMDLHFRLNFYRPKRNQIPDPTKI